MDVPGLADDVVDGVAARDPDAVAACYEALADPLLRYLCGLGADVDLAEELVEATFLELVEQAPQLRGGARGVRAWLFRAARNNLFDARRKVQRRGDVPLDEHASAGQREPGPGPEELALDGDRDAAVRAALAQLSEDQREVLVLRYAGGLTGPEIAEATGRTPGAVKALAHRGLGALARLLGTDPDAAAATTRDERGEGP